MTTPYSLIKTAIQNSGITTPFIFPNENTLEPDNAMYVNVNVELDRYFPDALGNKEFRETGSIYFYINSPSGSGKDAGDTLIYQLIDLLVGSHLETLICYDAQSSPAQNEDISGKWFGQELVIFYKRDYIR